MNILVIGEKLFTDYALQALDDTAHMVDVYYWDGTFGPELLMDSGINDYDRIRLIEPLDVYHFHNYIQQCFLIMTDSGGVQEEAPSLGKPVLVLRENTERPEGVAAGTLKLVGVEKESIYRGVKELLDNRETYIKMSKASNPYGDGNASKYIVDALLKIMR